MKRVVQIFKILAICISLITLHLSVPSSAVEYGQDATGDSNAVKVGGASGFLYSDRIVFTAAHVIDSTGGIDYWEKNGVIYNPGIVRMEGQKTYRAKKVLVAPTYRDRINGDEPRIDDFAIIILQESIPLKNEVVVATADDINLFIKNKTPVSMIGYGLQNSSQRENYEWGSFSPMKMTSYLVSHEELRNYYKVNINVVRTPQTILEYGIPNSREFGSNCDGDSGSGFFVEKESVRFYLGPAGGSQAGITNCRSFTRFGIGGGMSGITPTFKFMNLVKEAEAIVAEDKRKEFAIAEEARLAAELKAKQEAEARAQAESKAKAEEEAKAKAEEEARLKAEAETKAKAEAELRAKQEAEAKAAAEKKKATITCVKGKLTKKVTAVNPKCPVGYKKK